MYVYIYSVVATKCLAASDHNWMWWIWLSDVWRRCWVLNCVCVRVCVYAVSGCIHMYACMCI